MSSIPKLAGVFGRRTDIRLVLATSALLAAVVVPSVDARALAAPSNTQPPIVVIAPAVGTVLDATRGSWGGSPTSFSYQWLRCPRDGGAADGSNCTVLNAPDPSPCCLPVERHDIGYSFRVRVTGTNANGSASVVSAASPAAFEAPSFNTGGCTTPANAQPSVIGVNELSPPARLEIEPSTHTPAVITPSTRRITLRFFIIACEGASVRGALVYATPTPYSQFSGPEVTTNANGLATITLTRGRYFPATPRQQNLIVFVRARKPGEDLLGGISTRRLVSFPVRLR